MPATREYHNRTETVPTFGEKYGVTSSVPVYEGIRYQGHNVTYTYYGYPRTVFVPSGMHLGRYIPEQL